MSNINHDLIIIGAGPAGYVAAIRAAQLGFNTALVEKDKTLGGTCLNVGCIPSKALLASSEHFHFAQTRFASHGIIAKDLKLDLAAMISRKDKVVTTLTKGIDFLIKKNKITRYLGTGSLVDSDCVSVKDSSGSTKRIYGKHLILASGSVPIELPFLPFDGKTVLNSTHALSLPQVPKSLIVIGAGAIGLELGSVWSRLGSEVTVVEFLPKIAPGFDEELAKGLQKSLTKQGLKFHLDTKVESAEITNKQATLKAIQKGKNVEFAAEKVLVGVGRRPYTDDLNLDGVGIEMTERKRIKTNDYWQTNIPSIYAIGDCIDGPMLAHKAEDEGVAVVEHIAGKGGHVNYHAVPGVVYTHPEAASTGLTEEQANEQRIEYKVGKFNFQANGRALAVDQTDGFAKVIACSKTDRVLGAHIIGYGASELIAEAVTLIEFGGSAEDLARTVHAHPTMSETVKEAALSVDGRMIHG
ncbi:MAG: dihydrolipoyl dehydrogenase [Verrucomicrobiota bacterium]